jgi:hypothetical protein
MLLPILDRLDPTLVRRRALSMTFASRREDQLEGIENLWRLWREDAQQAAPR